MKSNLLIKHNQRSLAHRTTARSVNTSEQRALKRINGNANRIEDADKTIHNWYRFVLSYPPHLVRTYIKDFGLAKNSVLLDPFCGCGTTLVEGKLCGIKTVGVEANPFAHFASKVKTSLKIDSERLVQNANKIAKAVTKILASQGINDDEIFIPNKKSINLRTLPIGQEDLLLSDSLSPVPLHKTLILLNSIKSLGEKDLIEHELLALGKSLVFSISNLHFGPEVGLGKIKKDAPVISTWLAEIQQIASDLSSLTRKKLPTSKVLLADSREIGTLFPKNYIDAVITSPPYPNEKDYTRTTRLESVILGFIKDKAELRQFKKTLIRSNTRNVYKGDTDDKWIEQHPEILRIAKAIERRRIELEKDSGFERLYAQVTRLYFGGMAKHLDQLRKILKPGAQLAYVVGDQASYLRVMIRTGQLLRDIAIALGYEYVRTDLFRTRFASATRAELREEVIILKWNG